MKLERAVAYIRVSTSEQRLGPEGQRHKIASWARRQGVTVLATFQEEVSGSTPLHERPKLLQALASLGALRADALVVAHRDRLARSVLVSQAIYAIAHSSGKVIVSADGMGNGTDPFADFVRIILDACAQFEAGLIRERTRSALEVRRRQGKRYGEIPWGYRLHTDGETLLPDARERSVLCQVHELHHAGISRYAIRQRLAERGVTTRGGGRFYDSQIRAMLARGCCAAHPPLALPSVEQAHAK